jgi:dolichyl-diphosphooligosaccharide--protein glycosyltransferase
MVQVLELAMFVRWHLGVERFQQHARSAVWLVGGVAVTAAASLLLWMQLSGRLGWTGRSLSLLDPTYAARFIPIIASVSEHQPPAWTSFFFDLHAATVLAPVGLYTLFQRVDDGKVFLMLYGTLSWYFAGVMVRLMLTLAPAACMLAGIGAHALLSTFAAHAKLSLSSLWPHAALTATGAATDETQAEGAHVTRSADDGKEDAEEPGVDAAATLPLPLSLAGIAGVFGLLAMFALHATHAASEAYASPSIVLASQGADGSRVIFDDYREAYYWLRMNTEEDARIMSWWDYGYQVGTLANRTTIVDNNTWNTTSLATVGRALARSEEEAYPILQSLDVDYVLAVFGGMTGYQSDDIAKLLWPVRISGNEFPHIQESEYFADGQFRLDASGSPTLLNSLLYKMCYYRFGEVRSGFSQPPGYDKARKVTVGHSNFEFQHLEEAFTSEHWIVRIYKVKKPRSLQPLAHAPSVVRSRHRSTWPQSAQGTGTSQGEPVGPAARFLGCWADENDFVGRKYVGGGSGANLGLAKVAALKARTKYLATARVGADGHSFTFQKLTGRPIKGQGGGCSNPCQDDPKIACGCADAACSTPKLPGQEHNRRWAVYELQPQRERGG